MNKIEKIKVICLAPYGYFKLVLGFRFYQSYQFNFKIDKIDKINRQTIIQSLYDLGFLMDHQIEDQK